jgi:hypothetical protein
MIAVDVATHYAANGGAERFYARMGFSAQSISAILRL